MFDHRHYVPILKGKDGEFDALRELESQVRSRLTPVIEVVPFSAKTRLERHLDRIAKKLMRGWMSMTRPLFVDTRLLGDLKAADGSHVLVRTCKEFAYKGLQTIPITGLRRGASHHTAAGTVMKDAKQGLCLRLAGEDFTDPPLLPSRIDTLLRELGATKASVDLLIDLRSLATQDSAIITLLLRGVLGAIRDAKSYRTLTVAATAFPRDLTNVKPRSIQRTPRSEWIAWQALRGGAGRGQRIPTFGDYGIAHPELVEHEGPISVSGALRYTSESEWVIVKGRSLKVEKHAQMHGICRALMEQPEYRGPDFSQGDYWIMECAAGRVAPGNATTWRKVGNNHHLTSVVQALSNPAGT